MQYIKAEKMYFSSYIEGGLENVDEYVAQKSCNGVWGDDIELQALREIYNIPVEIYAYDNKPMKTFHESQEYDENGNHIKMRPFRLSYHGNSHYNSIVPLNWCCADAFLDHEKAGYVEDEAIQWALENQDCERVQEEEKVSESTLADKIGTV